MTIDPAPKTHVIVGGAAGIGAAVASRSRAQGESTIVWDIAGDRDITCDVGDPAATTTSVGETIELIGVPDRVTITAGIGHSGLLLDESPDDWDWVMRINARGPWLVMRAFAERMVDARSTGSIVATSSISGRLVDRNMGLYCASKAALDMLVRVAANEWGRHGIRVNALAPGVTQTSMLGDASRGSDWLAGVAERTPLGRLGQAGDIAEVIMAIHDLDWLTGQIVEADGGLGLHSPIDSYGAALAARASSKRE